MPSLSHDRLAVRLVIGGMAVLPLLSALLLTILINPVQYHHHKAAPVSWGQFYCNITSGSSNEIQRYCISGSETSCVPKLAYSDHITDYNICCYMHSRFICASSHHSLNGHVTLDAELGWDPVNEELFLNLLIRTDGLFQAECWLTGHYLSSRLAMRAGSRAPRFLP
jgi:hypothetical protein